MINFSGDTPPDITHLNIDSSIQFINPFMPIIEKIRLEILHVIRTSRPASLLSTLKFLSTLHTLQLQRVYRNKRSLFYDSVTIFKTQARVDSLIRRYTRKFTCSMADLFIKPSLKGIFHGEIVFYYKNGTIQAYQGKNIIPDMDDVDHVTNTCKKVLVVEKDTVVTTMANEALIIVCGKGYPCNNTIKLLLHFDAETEIFCITDFDPYGIDIFCTYKNKINKIKRMGICARDLFEYKIKELETIKLNKYDYFKINTILKKIDHFKENNEIKYDLEFIEAWGFKVELEAIVSNERFDVMLYLGKIFK